MSEYDLTLRKGTLVTENGTLLADLAVKDGRIAAIDAGLPAGTLDIDVAGRLVLPGGIDSHCHIEQRSGMGMMAADDFYTGTVSAAFGGTTTIIPFAAQHRGTTVADTLLDYHARAAAKAVVDYGFHLIVGDPTEKVLADELPAAIRAGITSFKVYTTYDAWRLSDAQILDLLVLAGREGALVMVHAENDDMIRWIAKRLLERGHVAPKFHGVAHDALAESEATHRIIALSRLLDVPVLIVHVSSVEAARTIRAAQMLGANIHAETCPQYVTLDAADMERPGVEGAKWCCSPPLRDAAAREAIWNGLADGTFGLFSSDHAPYRFDASGKIPRGDATTFKEMANGLPGIELRLPILFSEGVRKSRITLSQFVALGSANHARMYGLWPRKGTIAIGSDADLAVWNPDLERRVAHSMLHDATGYTPWEGRSLTGWPETVILRGRVVVRDGQLLAERGTGKFVVRGTPGPVARSQGVVSPRRLFRSFID